MADQKGRPQVPAVLADETEHRRQLALRANAGLPKDGSEPMTRPLPLWKVNQADIPAAADWEGGLLYVDDLDEFRASDGTVWRDGFNVSGFRGLIDGLILSNNATLPNTDLDISVGVARDDGNAAFMELSSILVKKISAAWAVGTNQGGLDTGTVAANTWYHVWQIKRSDTGVVDALFSLSATSPTMPTNYDLKRRIGAVLTDGSSNIIAFHQDGDRFIWDVARVDLNAANPGTTAVLRTLSTPLGVKTRAVAVHKLTDTTATAATAYLATDPAQTDTAPSPVGVFHIFIPNLSGSRADDNVELTVLTDESSRIRTRLSQSTADHNLTIQTIGWIDPRGRNL